MAHLFDVLVCVYFLVSISTQGYWIFEGYKDVNGIALLLLPEFVNGLVNCKHHKMHGIMRYLAYLDGTSFSDRLFWLLLTDSLVFRAGSSIRVWLDAGLDAWKHYVPVHGNLSDTCW